MVRRWSAKLATVGALGLAALAVGCGGTTATGDADSRQGDANGTGGGTVKIAQTSFPDALDPQLGLSVESVKPLAQAYPGLLTFAHRPGEEGARVVPGLAEAMPVVSRDGRHYRFTLREGLRYSDGSPVKASDFKATAERLLKLNSPGSNYGWTSIVGGREFLETKKGGISGIRTDDAARTVDIELVAPRSNFSHEMALWFGSPVPAGTPARNLTKSPPPGTGRYVIENVRQPNGYRLVRNEHFSPSLEGTAVDSGNADAFDVAIDGNLSNAVTQVAQNSVDWVDGNPPPDRLPELQAQYGDRVGTFPTNSVYYFFLNSEVAPFDDERVRQAVNHAVDFDALNRIQGGLLTDAHGVLPPGVPGYRKTSDLYPHDIEKAKQLIKEAGAEGAPVTVWGLSEPSIVNTVTYYADVLNEIGLDAQTKIISGDNYAQTVGDRATRAQTGFQFWSQDYPHPADFLDILLNPANVRDAGNTNLSFNAGDDTLRKMMAEANAYPEMTPEAIDRWAAIDRYVQEKAYWVPYANGEQVTFMSDRMDFDRCRGEHSAWTYDWAEFCLR